ncbi:RHS repeat domain-containing protein [Paenibacillus rhizoplanae]
MSRYQYDKSGNLITETSVIDGTERTTSYTYDGLGFAIGTTDPLGNLSRYQYDTMGNLLKKLWIQDTLLLLWNRLLALRMNMMQRTG